MSGKTEEMGRQQNQTSRTAVVREQDPTSKFPIHSAPETLRTSVVRDKKTRPASPPIHSAPESIRLLAGMSSCPFYPRAPQVPDWHPVAGLPLCILGAAPVFLQN
ncbi:uncharacterized protein LOC135096168 isoform X8 [Scylla paramamosain]|uniref:uncharacterized protein LOC135096168 isoform X8 n=1 Tax=Scylla paramamosain TaxID=85552 RepID=UPI0030829F43